MRQGFCQFSPVSPLLLWRKTHNHTLMTYQDGVNEKEHEKWRLDTGGRVTKRVGAWMQREIGQYESKPQEDSCTLSI